MDWWPRRTAGLVAVAAVAGVSVLSVCLLHSGGPSTAPAVAAIRQEGEQPVAVIADPGDVPFGSMTTLDASESQGNQLRLSWDFGDGSPPATGAKVQHAFAAVDDYTVRLTVQDAQGNTNSATRTVRVVPIIGAFTGTPVLGEIVPASSFPATLEVNANGPAQLSVKVGGAYLFSDQFDYVNSAGGLLLELPDVRVFNEDDPDVLANLINKPGATVPLEDAVGLTLSYPVSRGGRESVSYMTSLLKPSTPPTPPPPPQASASPTPAPQTPTPTPAPETPTPAPDDAHVALAYLQATPTPGPGTPRPSTPGLGTPRPQTAPAIAAATPAVASATPAAAVPPPPAVWELSYPTYLPTVGYPADADDIDGYYVKGDRQFHNSADPLVRRYAIKIARAGGIFPNEPQRATDNIYRYVYGLLGIGDPGELQTDLVLLSRVLTGALVPGARSGEYICIAHAYLLSSLTRTLGLPTRELTIGLGRGVAQDSSGAWIMNYYQEGANEVWYGGAWHHYDTWIGTRSRDDYLDTSLTYTTWYTYSEQSTQFIDVNGRPVGLAGHDYAIGKYAGSPGSPDQWRFLEQHTRTGIRVADPGPSAYLSADNPTFVPADPVSPGILAQPAGDPSGQ